MELISMLTPILFGVFIGLTFSYSNKNNRKRNFNIFLISILVAALINVILYYIVKVDKIDRVTAILVPIIIIIGILQIRDEVIRRKN